MNAQLNALNTTNLRILVSVCLAAIAVVLVLIGVLFRNWLPTEQQITVLKGCALLLFAMMGLDVAQFTSKRFSDATYAAAKNPSQPVSVDTPTPEPAKAATDGPAPDTPLSDRVPVPRQLLTPPTEASD